ncbi:hypothetical protein ACMBCM_06025 [Spiroplasma sp. K1]
MFFFLPFQNFYIYIYIYIYKIVIIKKIKNNIDNHAISFNNKILYYC